MTVEELYAILDLHHPDDPIEVVLVNGRIEERLPFDVDRYSTYGYQRNGRPQEVLTLKAKYCGPKPS